MLNIFAEALLIATRLNPEQRRHDTHRDDPKEQTPSTRYVFPKLGL